MCFGWYHELLSESVADDLAAAESTLLRMLDRGGMIVHVYRDTDPENPELVGRHCRLRSFIAANDRNPTEAAPCQHEVERFLLDPAHLPAWANAVRSSDLLEQRWSVVELWPLDLSPAEAVDCKQIYGKAVRTPPATVPSTQGSTNLSKTDRIARQL